MEQHKVNDLAQGVLLRCFLGMHVSCGINIQNMNMSVLNFSSISSLMCSMSGKASIES